MMPDENDIRRDGPSSSCRTNGSDQVWNTTFPRTEWPMPHQPHLVPPFEPIHRAPRWLMPIEVEQAIKDVVAARLEQGDDQVDVRALGWDLMQAVHNIPGTMPEYPVIDLDGIEDEAAK